MDVSILKRLIGDESLSDDDASILMARAKKLAANHYFWGTDDEPSEEEVEKFAKRYEWEIYDVAAAIKGTNDRDGEIEHTELGITRVWEKTNGSTINTALSKIPVKTYVWPK